MSSLEKALRINMAVQGLVLPEVYSQLDSPAQNDSERPRQPPRADLHELNRTYHEPKQGDPFFGECNHFKPSPCPSNWLRQLRALKRSQEQFDETLIDLRHILERCNRNGFPDFGNLGEQWTKYHAARQVLTAELTRLDVLMFSQKREYLREGASPADLQCQLQFKEYFPDLWKQGVRPLGPEDKTFKEEMQLRDLSTRLGLNRGRAEWLQPDRERHPNVAPSQGGRVSSTNAHDRQPPTYQEAISGGSGATHVWL